MRQSPDPARLPAFFAELAEWAASQNTPATTIAYGGHEDQVVDLRGPEGAPVAVVIHGGFWRPDFTRANTTAVAIALASAGWRTANVEYRRLGPGRYRELLDDVARAANAVSGSVAIGHSAGAQLALWLAARGSVTSAVTLGGICDLGAAAAAGAGDHAVVEFLGGSPADVPHAYDEADPGRRLPLGARQVLVHGGRDDRVPIDLARAYAERARATGDDCRILELDDADHFDVIDPRYERFDEILGALPQ